MVMTAKREFSVSYRLNPEPVEVGRARLGSAELEVFRDTSGANPQVTVPRLAQKPETP